MLHDEREVAVSLMVSVVRTIKTPLTAKDMEGLLGIEV